MKPEQPTILPWLAWMQPERKPYEYESAPPEKLREPRDRAAQKQRRRLRERRRR